MYHLELLICTRLRLLRKGEEEDEDARVLANRDSAECTGGARRPWMPTGCM